LVEMIVVIALMGIMAPIIYVVFIGGLNNLRGDVTLLTSSMIFRMLYVR